MLVKETYEEEPVGSQGLVTLWKLCKWTFYYSDGSIEQLTMKKTNGNNMINRKKKREI